MTTRKSARASAQPARILHGIRATNTSLRSANVEHDIGDTAVESYVLTSQGLELLSRLEASIEGQDSSRAWAVTGPYGTGKSSFAVFLAALLCSTAAETPRGRTATVRQAALAKLAEHDDGLAARIKTHSGMIRAAATARREPAMHTVVRALQAGVAHRWGKRAVPQPVQAAMTKLADPDPSSADVLAAAKACADCAPLLLIIDEFGKNLEHFAAQPAGDDANSDIYFLQELAELASGKRAAPIYLLTFQHATFADYASHSDALQRREWSKIQGRFHDVTFTEQIRDVAALVAGSLDQGDLSAADARRLRDYGLTSARMWREHGFEALLPADPDLLAATFPLHPMTLASLPRLCAVLGQHDRTLAGFLTADEPHTIARFLHADDAPARAETTERGASSRGLATVGLDRLYDYFAAAVRGPALASPQASRWLEIETRLSTAADIAAPDLALLKVIALLNVVDNAGALRANLDNIAFAALNPQELDSVTRSDIKARLDRLTDASFLTYRIHADEYRLWAGSDIDLNARLRVIREQFNGRDIAQLLIRSYSPPAIVAGKHSQKNGLLRHFTTTVTDQSGTVTALAASPGPADGTLVFHLGTPADLPSTDSKLPVLLGTSADAALLVDNAREVLALDDLLAATDLDPVARAEVRERLTIARTSLTSRFASAYHPARGDVSWTLRIPGQVEEVLPSHRSLSAIVSRACDDAYPLSPVIRNEMLGRHQLTSQGAKARRELLSALIENPTQEHAGLTGYGPEVAMYDGVVNYLELHAHRPQGSAERGDDIDWQIPSESSTARPAFDAIRQAILEAPDGLTVAELHQLLIAPPYGVKAGLLPVLVVGTLAVTADDIAIFEDGSFLPQLSADFLERLIKTPDRVLLRFAPAGPGQRATVIERLADKLHVLRPTGNAARRSRTPSLVRVTAALLDTVRGATTYALTTRSVSAHAQAVREALKTATDPAELIFVSLPAAVGKPTIPPDALSRPKQADALVIAIMDALHELHHIDERLTDDVAARFAAGLRLPDANLATARAELRTQASRIRTPVIDPAVRALIAHATYDGDLPDEDWLEQAALIIEGQPMPAWRDENLERFGLRTREITATIARLYALHFDAAHNEGESFDARRITLTRPDGHEDHLVVAIPSERQRDLASLLAETTQRARQTFGPHGEQILLAALLSELLSTDSSGIDSSRETQDESRPSRQRSTRS